MNLKTRDEARASGQSHFFTGQPCTRGHIVERMTANGSCVECQKQRMNIWRSKNRDRCVQHSVKSAAKRAPAVAAYKANWRAKNRPRLLAKDAEYRRTNAERLSEGKKNCYRRKRDEYLERGAEYRRKNADDIRARRQAQKAENPEKFRAWDRVKRAKRRDTTGRHTANDVADIKRRQKHRCGYCRVRLGAKYHVDHIVALSRGGSNDRRNLQILCQPCNQAKHAHDPIDFARKQGMLL